MMPPLSSYLAYCRNRSTVRSVADGREEGKECNPLQPPQCLSCVTSCGAGSSMTRDERSGGEEHVSPPWPVLGLGRITEFFNVERTPPLSAREADSGQVRTPSAWFGGVEVESSDGLSYWG
jgi:hypothetical protein